MYAHRRSLHAASLHRCIAASHRCIAASLVTLHQGIASLHPASSLHRQTAASATLHRCIAVITDHGITDAVHHDQARRCDRDHRRLHRCIAASLHRIKASQIADRCIAVSPDADRGHRCIAASLHRHHTSQTEDRASQTAASLHRRRDADKASLRPPDVWVTASQIAASHR
jgi:hypothetical protein